MNPNPLDRVKILIVDICIWFLNTMLSVVEKVLFPRKIKNPKNILIFKVGNIGDVTCVIPSFIAIRRTYPHAKITLLTSPGKRGTSGAQDLITGAWYLDSIINYYSEDINTRTKQKEMITNLRRQWFDYFIQIPDDWASFRVLFRNLIFAKLIGAHSAVGFRIRTFLSIFRKTQIDYVLKEKETESQLRLLKSVEITTDKVEFDFPISKDTEIRINEIIKKRCENKEKYIVGICPGGKDETKKWPVERFSEVADYLIKRYGVMIIIFGGGENDKKSADIIKNVCGEKNVFDMVNNYSIHEQIIALKSCVFLITNDTGPMHWAAAVGTPVIALFSVRNILGSWFPYGKNNKVLYHRNIVCDYTKGECVKKSVLLITVEEVIGVCIELLEIWKKKKG